VLDNQLSFGPATDIGNTAMVFKQRLMGWCFCIAHGWTKIWNWA